MLDIHDGFVITIKKFITRDYAVNLCVASFPGLKVKSVFSTYFSIESSNPKNIFCIINLVQWQVYRVEKVGIYWLYLSKKSIFKFFVTKKLMVAQKKIHAPEMMSDQFGIRFKMFPIVDLTKLGGQNIKLGLYSENF